MMIQSCFVREWFQILPVLSRERLVSVPGPLFRTLPLPMLSGLTGYHFVSHTCPLTSYSTPIYSLLTPSDMEWYIILPHEPRPGYAIRWRDV